MVTTNLVLMLMLKINTVTMEEKIVEILFKTMVANTEIEQCARELLNLFSVNYYGETLYNSNGVIPSKFEDEKPRIVTIKDDCS